MTFSRRRHHLPGSLASIHTPLPKHVVLLPSPPAYISPDTQPGITGPSHTAAGGHFRSFHTAPPPQHHQINPAPMSLPMTLHRNCSTKLSFNFNHHHSKRPPTTFSRQKRDFSLHHRASTTLPFTSKHSPLLVQTTHSHVNSTCTHQRRNFTLEEFLQLISSPPILGLAMFVGFFIRPIYESYIKQKRSLHAPSERRMRLFFHRDNKVYTKDEASTLEMKQKMAMKHPYNPKWLEENQKRIVWPNVICLTAEQGSGKSMWAESILQSVFARGDVTLFRFSKYLFRQDAVLQLAFEVCRELDPRITNWTIGRFREHFVGATEEERRKKVATYFMDTLFIERLARKKYLNSTRKRMRNMWYSLTHSGKMYREIPLVVVDDIQVLEERYNQMKAYDEALAEVLKGMIQSFMQSRIASTCEDKTFNTVFLFNNEGTVRWVEEITRDEKIILAGGFMDHKFPAPSDEWMDALIQQVAPNHSPKTREFIIREAAGNIGALISACMTDPQRWAEQRRYKMRVLVKKLLSEPCEVTSHAKILSMLYLLASFKHFTMKQIEKDLNHPTSAVNYLERRIVKREYVRRENSEEMLEMRFTAKTTALQTAIDTLYKDNQLLLTLRVIQESDRERSYRMRHIHIKELTRKKLLSTIAKMHHISPLQLSLYSDKLGYIQRDEEVMELNNYDIIYYTIDKDLLTLSPAFGMKKLMPDVEEHRSGR